MRSQGRGRRGFTLVEILIAILILSIGLVAIMGVQFAALNGVTNAQDVSASTELGRRVLELMRIEALQWRTNLTTDVTTTVYAAGSPFGTTTLLPQAVGSSTWVALNAAPVDERMVRTDSGSDRYCIFGRGSMAPAVGPTSRAARVQLAVVFPPANDAFGPSAGGGVCSNIDTTDLAPDSLVTFEINTGLRAVFVGGQIVQPNWR